MNNHFDAVTRAYGAKYSSVSSYIIGFIFSIVLTLIPYIFVVAELLSGSKLVMLLVICALLQLLVQATYFLHLDIRSHARWNTFVFIFIIFTIAFLVIGTLWIMKNLNYNAMSAFLEKAIVLQNGD